jgi:hypothetical protein
LVSVLHHLPPPDTNLRHWRGYQQITDEDVENAVEEDEAEDAAVAPEDASDAADRDLVEHESWHSLIWSFISSGVLAVRFGFYNFWYRPEVSLVCRVFLPGGICHPRFR